MSEETRDAEWIALAAIKITNAMERQVFIQQACSGNETLRRQVEAMIAAQLPISSDNDLAVTQATGDASSSIETTGHFERDSEADGRLIGGKYKLLKQIGEGGMGSVWAAEQREPVNRTVALKLIKKGMDSAGVLARFDAERQALALMDHPNIARIYDGGVTESGAPYFVMELVKGESITSFCDLHRLTPIQRLELFVPVCQAIQHAHHKGIIHRDIKPSNVLVTIVDDRPLPKVIDFGVAKATGPALTELSLDTGFSVVGTPQYMSPEQASMNSIDIDTRSDIYSLGILLYELLAGSTPFKKEELAKAGYLEILRVIREVDPPRPSTKLSNAEALPSLSAARGTDPKRLSLILRNELDWIVMRALEKDRTRRYETANAFAADINRYLHGEPVLAHPPTYGYRLQKFLRKNRGSVVAASLVSFALIAGIIGTSLGMVEAQRQTRLVLIETKLKDDALQREAQQRELAEKERNRAEQSRNLAEQRLIEARRTISAVVNSIPNLLERVPLAAGAQKFILTQMDDLLSATSATDDRDEKLESSRSWGLMAVETRAGQQAMQIGELDQAEIHYRRALKIAKEVYEGNPRDRAKASGNLALANELLAELSILKNQPNAHDFIQEAIRFREEAITTEQAEESIGRRRASLGSTWNRLANIRVLEIEGLPSDQRQAAAQESLTTARTGLQHLQSAIGELVDSPADLATARRDEVAAAVTLAKLAVHAKDEPTVIEGYELAKSSSKALLSVESDRVFYKISLAEVCGSYGDYLLVKKQDFAAARAQYAESMTVLRNLVDNDVHLEQLKQNRIFGYYRLGLAAEALGNAEQVRKYFERACLLSDLHLREKSDRVRDPELIFDDQVQLMLEQAWAGQAESAIQTARSIKLLCGDAQQASEKPWAPGGLARASFALAIAAEKGGLSDQTRQEARQEALQTLRDALAAGYDDIQYLLTDPDVAPLRRIEGFDAIQQSLSGTSRL